MFNVVQPNLVLKGIVSVVQTPFTEAGHIESDGVYWLLAYWMWRYYGLIE